MCFILAFSWRLEECWPYESWPFFDCRCRSLLEITHFSWHVTHSPSFRFLGPQMLFLLKNVSKFDWRLSLFSFSSRLSSLDHDNLFHAAWYQLKVSHDSFEAIIVQLHPKYRPCNAMQSLSYSLQQRSTIQCLFRLVSWRFSLFSREFLSVWTFSYRSVPHNSHHRWLLLFCVPIKPLITYTYFVFFLLRLLLMLYETGNYFHPAFVPLLCYTLWDDEEVWWDDGNDKVLRICKRRLNFEYFWRSFFWSIDTSFPLPPFVFSHLLCFSFINRFDFFQVFSKQTSNSCGFFRTPQSLSEDFIYNRPQANFKIWFTFSAIFT